MSNIQAQIDALAVSIQTLDNTLSNVTGNTLSNYNQLSRIVSQQGNIYNAVYYGTGNIITGNLFVNSIANISGNINTNGIINMGTTSGKKLAIYDNTNNDFQFTGFNILTNTLGYNVAVGSTQSHVFYGATSSTTRSETARIRGAITESTSTTTGTIITPTGAGIACGGNLNVAGNTTVSNNLFTQSDANIQGNLEVNSELRVTGNNFLIYPPNGLWISSSASDSVNPRLRLFTTNTIGSYFDFSGASNGNLFIRYGSPNPVTKFTFDGLNGRLGLGITPTVQLDLSTDGARKLTTTTWSTGSDARIKEDITYANLDTCYNIVSNIALHHYRWIPEIAEKVEDKSMLGWIAQEVETVFPKAVTKSNDYGYEDFRTLNADQMYKVMYGALQKVMIENRNLSNIVNDLTLKLNDLSNIIIGNIQSSNISLSNTI